MPLRFFDQIRFYPASEAELAQIRRDFPVGRHRLRTEAGTFSLRDHEAFLDREAASIDSFRTTQRQAFAEERTRWQAAGQNDYVAEPDSAPAQDDDDEWPDAAVRVATQVPGSVWKVLVTPGAVVAPVSGVVLAVNCGVGSSVRAGQSMVVLISGDCLLKFGPSWHVLEKLIRQGVANEGVVLKEWPTSLGDWLGNLYSTTT